MNDNRDTPLNHESNRDTVMHKTDVQHGDLPDSPHDAERLKPEETLLDLPDVSDIPGQEFVTVPSLGELADTTISSADEEGEGLFDDAVTTGEPEPIPGTERDPTGRTGGASTAGTP